MGCNCGSKTRYKWEAVFANGSPSQTYDTFSEAQAAVGSAGGGKVEAVDR